MYEDAEFPESPLSAYRSESGLRVGLAMLVVMTLVVAVVAGAFTAS